MARHEWAIGYFYPKILGIRSDNEVPTAGRNEGQATPEDITGDRFANLDA